MVEVPGPVGVRDGEVGPLGAVLVFAGVGLLLIIDVAEYRVPSLARNANAKLLKIMETIQMYRVHQISVSYVASGPGTKSRNLGKTFMRYSVHLTSG